MKVLLLSGYPERLEPAILRAGDTTLATTERIPPDWLEAHGVEFVVSYGYRHLIRDEVIRRYPGRIINLHISLLPWNRGADPNLWSWVDDTPKGVTIHQVDAGLDTGPILIQEPVRFSGAETLASSYAVLRVAVESLFDRGWADLRTGHLRATPQTGTGSSHAARDKEPLMARLPAGWDTPVDVVARTARALGL